MNNSFSNIFKSLKGSYNLLDFAQKSKGKPLPRSRKSIKKEYEILKQYKDGLLLKNEAITHLTNLKNIDQILYAGSLGYYFRNQTNKKSIGHHNKGYL